MKWIGFLVVTLAGTAVGLSALKEKQMHFRLLVETERMLLDLERRLQYAAVPIREWLAEIIALPQFSRLTFLRDVLNRLINVDLETAWCMAVCDMHGFGKAEVAVLQTLGMYLGKSDTATQLECVRGTVSTLSEYKEMAADIVRKAEKLYVWLGTCMGMAVGLLLI